LFLPFYKKMKVFFIS